MSEFPIAPSEHGQKAINLMIKARELASEVEGFRYATRGRRVKIGNTATLPDEFLQMLAVACDANPGFAAKVEITGAEIRDRLEFRRQFVSFAQEMQLVAKGIEDTIAELLADLGHRALRAYKTAQDMEASAERASLIPHLTAMKRALNRGRKKAKKGEDPNAAAKKGDAK